MSDPDGDVLERNVAALLQRAWRPVEVREPWRSELRARFVERAAAEAATAPRRSRARAAVLLAAAALVLVALGIGLRRDSGPVAGADELLARGEVALRADAPGARGPRGDWRAASADERARGVAIGSGVLEVATPAERGVLLRLAEGTAHLEPRTRVRIVSDDARLTLEHGSGALALQRRTELGAWRLETGAGAFEPGAAWLEVAYVDAASVADRVEGLAAEGSAGPGQLVRLRVREGRVTFAGELLPTTRDVYVRGGRVLAPGDDALAAGAAGGAERRAAPGAEGPASAGEDQGPPPGLFVAGRVLDGDTREPVERFRVLVRRERELPKVSVPVSHEVVSADGRFTLELGEGAGAYSVVVEARGFATWSRRARRIDPGEQLEVLLERGGAAAGHVLDARTGTPVEGALVLAETDVADQVLELHGVVDGEPPAACARTDANGAYSLPHLSPGRHVLRASHPDFAPAWSAELDLASGERVEVAPIALTQGGRIFGVVKRDDGAPWPGSEVIASVIFTTRSMRCMTYGWATTGDDGSYMIEHLPPAYYVVFNAAEQPNEDEGWSRIQQVELGEGQELEVPFVPGGAGSARVRGRLLDPRHEPLGLQALYLDDDPVRGFSGWTATSTAADGSFEFQDVPAGRYTLFLGPAIDGSMRLVHAFQVHGAALPPIELVLQSTLVDARVSAGGTLPRVGFVIERMGADGESSFAGKGPGSAPGRILVENLPPGRYRLVVFDESDGLAQLRTDPFELLEGTPSTLAFEMSPGGALRVRVVDAAGNPLAGAVVECARGGELAAGTSPADSTDASGTRSMGTLAPGRWTVSAKKPGFEPRSETVDVLVGQRTEHTITLRAAGR